MKSCAQYIAETKAKLGDSRMSDQKLGAHLGYAQQTIAKAKSGGMSDHVAIAVAKELGYEPGEVIFVARLERENTAEVRQHLESWMRVVKKALATVPSKAANTLVVFVAALWLLLPARDVQAAGLGGAGR